jgi:hypothetical protein
VSATCASCGAAIIWTITEAGKRMPVDAVPAGKVTVLVRDPHGGSTPISKSRDHYVSHFATCPNAQQHRRRLLATTETEEPEST